MPEMTMVSARRRPFLLGTIAITLFKAQLPRLVRHVARTKKSIVITKRGKPVARLVSFEATRASAKPGGLASTLVFEKDIVATLGARAWGAARRRTGRAARSEQG